MYNDIIYLPTYLLHRYRKTIDWAAFRRRTVYDYYYIVMYTLLHYIIVHIHYNISLYLRRIMVRLLPVGIICTCVQYN